MRAAGAVQQLQHLTEWVSAGGLTRATPPLLQLTVPICVQQLRCALLHQQHDGDSETLQLHFSEVGPSCCNFTTPQTPKPCAARALPIGSSDLPALVTQPSF